MKKKGARVLGAVLAAIMTISSPCVSAYASTSSDVLTTYGTTTETDGTAENTVDGTYSDTTSTDTTGTDTSQADSAVTEYQTAGTEGSDGASDTTAVVDSTMADGVYIREFSTQCFSGGTQGVTAENKPLYTWTASSYQKGHAFSFRINLALSGEKTAPTDSVHITIPASILIDRNGNAADSLEMSVPSKKDVEAAQNGTGESIDSDVDFAWYQQDSSVILYNIRELSAGYNGFVEVSYLTKETSFDYMDGVTGTFSASAAVNSTASENTYVTADPIAISIDTSARLSSVYVGYPSLYTTWQSEWGTNPDSAGNYWYLLWNIRSDISATQPYYLTFTDNPVQAQAIKDTSETVSTAHDVVAAKFSGNNWQSAANGTPFTSNSAVTGNGYRYDYAVTRIPISSTVYSYTAQNAVNIKIQPADGKDASSEATGSNVWKWTRPSFSEPVGHVLSHTKADGAYRQNYLQGIYYGTTHFADSMSMHADNYSRYDLEDFEANAGETGLYNGLDYAVWTSSWIYAWTKDLSQTYDNPQDAYGKVPVTTVLEDEGIYASIDDDTPSNAATTHFPSTNNDPSKYARLTENDFTIDKIDFSWFCYDAVYNNTSCQFGSTTASYKTPEQVEMYVKETVDGEWEDIGSMSLTGQRTMKADLDSAYVSSTKGNTITFADGKSIVAYKLTVTNTRYYTELFTVPDIALREDSTTLQNALKSGTQDALQEIKIINNSTGIWYTSDHEDENAKLAESYSYDTDYLRSAQHNSFVKKKVVSTYNNVKQRNYTITWDITMGETVTNGTGQTSYVPQQSGVYYDLLPDGAAFTKKSVQVTDQNGKEISAYNVRTIQNYKGTGRTMLIVKVNAEADRYNVQFDTIHAWNNVKDYGTTVYNPVAYETGNKNIANGFPDNGGTYYADGKQNTGAIRDADLMSSLDDNVADSDNTGKIRKFIYAETNWDINAITAASSGITGKVMGAGETKYTYDTDTTLGGLYSYEIRFQNTYVTKTRGLIFFDSLENYSATNTTEAKSHESDWHGTLQSIDVNQLKASGVSPVVYAYTGDTAMALDSDDVGIKASEDYDFSKHTDFWKQVDASALSDLSAWQKENGKITAIAVDCRQNQNGSGFLLSAGRSVMFHLYMKAPDTVPEAKSDSTYPYAYNNIYVKDTIADSYGQEQNFYIHQDYTSVRMFIANDLQFRKVNKDNENEGVEGITYRITGTSDYGTLVDMKVKTDSNGYGTFEKVEKGTYLLQEYETTDDWLLDTTEHKLVIDATGKVLVDGDDYTNTEDSTDKYYLFKDQYVIHGDLTFTKKELTNPDNTPLLGVSGVKFKLSGISDYGVQITKYAESDTSGQVSFQNIQKGTYDLQEVSIPAEKPYVVSDRIYQVVCDDSGHVTVTGVKDNNTVLPAYTGAPGSWNEETMRGKYTEWVSKTDAGAVTIYNEYRFFPLTLFKYEVRKDTNGNDTNVGLPNAEFTMTGTSDLGTSYNVTATSDESGLVKFSDGFEKGTYLLQETQAPQIETERADGTKSTIDFVKDESRYIVTIDYRGNIKIVNYDNGNTEVAKDTNGNFMFENDRIADKRITITKVWDDDDVSNDDRPLPKITLTTRDPAYTKVFIKFQPNGGTWSDGTTTAKQASFLIKTDDNGCQYYEPYSGSATAADIVQMAENAGKKDATENILMTDMVFSKWDYTDTDGNQYTYTVAADTDGTIKIKKYDADGNQVKTLPEDGETITAEWKYPTLTTGAKFNSAMMTLAGDATTDDTGTKSESSIKTISVTTSAPADGTTTEDVSENGDGSIVAWFDSNSGTIDLYASGASNVAMNEDSSGMFKGLVGLTSVDVSNWDTSDVTNMNSMFNYCVNLSTLDVSKWNTHNATNMGDMFSNCFALTTLDVSGWDTSNVTNMSNMFNGCGLTTLDVSGWDTSNVMDMSYMFSYCSNLATLNVSGWNTSKVTNMDHMFSNDSALTTLDVSKWNVSNVSSMSYMFFECYGLTTLDVSGWDTSNVTDMSYMFGDSTDATSVTGCLALTTLDVSGWNTSKVTNMDHMFVGCTGLTTLNVSGWDTSNVTNMAYMFFECSKLATLDVSGWDTSNVTTMDNMFYDCNALKTLDVSKWKTSSVTNMNEIFSECTGLTTLNVSGWDTSKVTNMRSVFYNCTGLTTLDLSGWTTSNVTDMSSMFYGCSGLTTLDLSTWNTSNVTNMSDMFNSCSGLTTIYVGSNWSTTKVTSGNMFSGDTNLVGGAGTKYNSSHIDKAYARVDGGTSAPGYFTSK